MILLVILNCQGYKEGGGSLVSRYCGTKVTFTAKKFVGPLIGKGRVGSRDCGQVAVNWDES